MSSMAHAIRCNTGVTESDVSQYLLCVRDRQPELISCSKAAKSFCKEKGRSPPSLRSEG